MTERHEPATTSRTYDAAPNVVQQSINDDVILLDLDSGTYFTLAAIGAQIWQRLCAGANADEVVSALTAEYDVDATVVSADVDELIHQLSTAGLIHAA